MSFSLTVGAQKNPFDDLKYDRVVAFEFYGIGNRTIDRILVEDQTRIDNQITIDSIQTREFEEIITKKGANDQGTKYERPLKGFSKSTRIDLDAFISRLNFDKYRKPLESIFDN